MKEGQMASLQRLWQIFLGNQSIFNPNLTCDQVPKYASSVSLPAVIVD